MNDMEEKLGAILGNPQMMQQIMSMAQTLGSPAQEQQASAHDETDTAWDASSLKTLASLAQSTGIDQKEAALLHALKAYLSGDRVYKLEKAMRAAKLAQLATSALGQSALQSLLGR